MTLQGVEKMEIKKDRFLVFFYCVLFRENPEELFKVMLIVKTMSKLNTLAILPTNVV
jgi:hypothetical protein